MSDAPRPPCRASEAYRPRLHYTAADTWINDPNGLVYADGFYHLFFQNNPYGTDHANLSWGHAVSRDLTHWADRPVAISCDENEQIFSGSIVFDESNTSGFGEAGCAPLVAVYTSCYSDASPLPGIQAQSLAFSLDHGETWSKHSGNPVLDRGSSDFRDPKVFRYTGAAGEYWVMVAVEAVGRKVVLYRSDDLKDWTRLSEFTSTSPVGKIWECPDLFPLLVDADPENVKWVLVVSLNRDEGQGGSAALFFIGDFDGVAFTASGAPGAGNPGQPEWEWLDYGRDYYAAVSFNDAPAGRRILMGWMSNWDYAGAVPASPWRGAMALPREAALCTVGDRIALRQNAIARFAPAGDASVLGPREIRVGVHRLNVPESQGPCVIEAVFDAGSSTEFGLLIRQDGTEATRIGYDVEHGELILDRRRSGTVSFDPTFASREAAPVELVDGQLALRLYVDVSSIEAFAQDGLVTLTELVFPDPSSSGVSLYAVNGTARLIRLELIPLEDVPVVRAEAGVSSAR